MNEKTIRKMIKDMRTLATDFDAKGKAVRNKERESYKAPEYFRAADGLRTAANATEYVIA